MRFSVLDAIVLKDVSKQFGGFLAVRNLSFEVPQGSIFGLLGPNGAGKTTTIRMIINIIAPDSGEILLLGRQVNSQSQRQIGYLPEELGLYVKRRLGDQLVFFVFFFNETEAKEIYTLYLRDAKDR